MDLLSGSRNLRRWALANLVANMMIVWTGALVRLTKSGLGCPTWPQCDATSYVPQAEAEWHTLIEFGNRLLTFALAFIAIGTALAAFRARTNGRPRPLLRTLTVLVGLGICLQAVVGGWSVLVQLNPWVVGLHLVLSVGLIVACVAIVHESFDALPTAAPRRVWLATQVVFWLSLAMMYLGTIVTGAGPHSGDGAAQRNGFDLSEVARVHSLTMWVTLGLTIWLAAAARPFPRVRRAALGVIGCAALQAVIGYTQYFTHLPIGIVFAHMIGTTLYTIAVSHLWLSAAPTASAQKTSGSTAAARNTIAR